MNKFQYTFFAKVNKSFIIPFEKELKQFGIQTESLLDLNRKGLNYIKFKSNMESVWKIMLYSRLVEGLKIQISDGIKAPYIF